MNLFKNIIEVFKIKQNYDKNSMEENLLNILFDMYSNIYDLKSKFNLFNDTINNIFIKNETKQKYIELFSRIQKVYFSFIKFNNQYKFKKYKTLIDTDLLLNPISKNNKYCIQIIQEKYKYLFTCNDIINLFNNSLTSSSYLFFQLSPIKNPYNNLEFDKSTLYNMYFFIKEKTISNIELINKYFKSNFCLHKFKDEYKYLIRDYIVKNYIKNTSNEQFKDLLDEMMVYFYIKCNFKNKIQIHDDFPISDLRIIMKDYLYLYLTSKYSLIEYKKYKSENILREKLIKFHNYNPLFGRKYFKIIRYFCNNKMKFKNKLEIRFNKEHINFNDKSNIWLTKKNMTFFSEVDRRTVNNFNHELNNLEYERDYYLSITQPDVNENEDNEYTDITSSDVDDESIFESDERSVYENPEEYSETSSRSYSEETCIESEEQSIYITENESENDGENENNNILNN